MSSLAAARADNFYYPPNFDPKKGGINKQQGQHPLRERAKKLDQGILVIRFEMPFNVWCAGCNHLIGKGVRFNAEKKQIGSYHSTKIWSFIMKAPCCGQKIEVQTDPKNTEYVVASGGRRKAEEFTAEDAETLELPEKAEAAKLDDPFFRLEHGTEDNRKARIAVDRLVELHDDSEAKYRNDYEMNKALRRQVRAARKDEQQRDQQRDALGLPSHISLLPASAEDAAHAAQVRFGASGSRFEQNREAARQSGAQKQRHGMQTVKALVTGVKRSLSDKASQLLKRQRLGTGVKLRVSNPEARTYLVKRSLDGYMPGSKQSRPRDSSKQSSYNALLTRPTTEGKRKRKLTKRSSFSDDSLTLRPSAFAHLYDYAMSETSSRRSSVVRKYTNSGRMTVDRGVQVDFTMDEYKRPNLFVPLSPDSKISEEEFVNTLAVNTLALLRQSPESSSEPESVQTPSPSRRRRKLDPPVRSLF
ncbi:hypothetical protein WJX72_001716 [[Myrmecia] bisecta]|uniref:Coiled-coil domain-containing protein 130 n=1 Tax=[Myrmecia] bisecta TaxID=41462 RepID=A0AAW1R620_9CHLO